MAEDIPEKRSLVRFESTDLETFMRPLFGIYIAIAFGIIFNSVFLGLLAGAFLVYLPPPKREEDAKGVNMINKIYFGVIMIGS